MRFTKLLSYFFFWRVALFFVLFFAIGTIPLQYNFLGGGLPTYLSSPYIWAWLNFDGEHYASIAQNGYRPLEYFFFPLFPLIVRYIGDIFGRSLIDLAIIGVVISNILFILGSFGLIKLIRLDYAPKIAHITILTLLLFPTSFYFGSFFTESLFFAEVVWAMYFARKGNWIAAGIIGGMATATRIIGVALFPAFLIEAYLQRSKGSLSWLLWTVIAGCLSSIGILLYMWFMHERTGNPLEFMTSLNMVYGAQRSDSFVLLPQVLYRYIFKIVPYINYGYLPQLFSTYLEFISGVLFLILAIFAFVKLRLSYAVYLALGYIIPTLSGSFSSFPRYALVLFPAFILMAIYIDKLPKWTKLSLAVFSGILLSLATSYFVRGYWIS